MDEEPLIVTTTFAFGNEEERWTLSPRWEPSFMILENKMYFEVEILIL